MAISLHESTRKKLEDTLRYYEDIGVREYFLDRAPQAAEEAGAVFAPVLPAASVSRARVAAAAESAMLAGIPVPQGPSLFEAIERVQNDSLERIRADIGDCKRCRLCERRTNIVFGDGSGKAELVFIGEGPGHDEDVQGLPFVGRAGKLLTQMIEAMGLQRRDVYICNVVKCRPPENRAPEKDERPGTPAEKRGGAVALHGAIAVFLRLSRKPERETHTPSQQRVQGCWYTKLHSWTLPIAKLRCRYRCGVCSLTRCPQRCANRPCRAAA